MSNWCRVTEYSLYNVNFQILLRHALWSDSWSIFVIVHGPLEVFNWHSNTAVHFYNRIIFKQSHLFHQITAFPYVIGTKQRSRNFKYEVMEHFLKDTNQEIKKWKNREAVHRLHDRLPVPLQTQLSFILGLSLINSIYPEIFESSLIISIFYWRV